MQSSLLAQIQSSRQASAQARRGRGRGRGKRTDFSCEGTLGMDDSMLEKSDVEQQLDMNKNENPSWFSDFLAELEVILCVFDNFATQH